MTRQVPAALLKSLRSALDDYADKMVRAASEYSQHNLRSFQSAGKKVNKLWNTCLNVPYKEAK